MSKAKAGKKIPCLITTNAKLRGVFMGYINDPKTDLIYDRGPGEDPSIIATEVRMCFSWSEAMNGILGLASKGPDKNCRITPAAPEMRLEGVSAVARITPKAEKAWKKEPWSGKK